MENPMKAQAAFDALHPKQWAATDARARITILEHLQSNMTRYAADVGSADVKMRNNLIGEDLYSAGVGVYGTVGLMGATVAATIDLYRSIAAGKPMTARQVTDLGDGTYDIEVFPQTAKDKVTAGRQRGHLRVRGVPKRVDPLHKEEGVIAVLGAGNYSSSVETVKALFWENKAVILKAHPLNTASDAVWQKIFAPLVDPGALSFCDPDDGVALTKLDGLSAIYFTGGSNSAKAIMEGTDTPLVSECGGNNPCIVVPGDRRWSDKEISHQAIQFVSLAKLNGGAVCGRAQTLVTSKHWPQREQFLDAIRKAFTEDTPAVGTYYPGSEKVRDAFAHEYPGAEVLQAEGGKHEFTDGLLITGADPDSLAAQEEAFSQVIAEIPLDEPADADQFIPAAVSYCNEKLLGSLTCMVIIDNDTRKAHSETFDSALGALNYGSIAVNTIPPLVFANPYLIWGGNEEGRELVSGTGNFGNLLGFENIEKAIMYDNFVSMTHFLYTKKRRFDLLMSSNARYVLHPSWTNLTRMTATAMRATMARKDF
jgi:acyl-CoA reductase-like NAD-dependent aldehyde dehydrogenase